MIKDIEYFYRNGNASSVGSEMMSDGVTKDYYYALCRVQESSEIEDYDVSPEKGFTLHFEPKEYHFSKPIELVRCMHLLGSGGNSSGTVFTFLQDSPGIIVHSNASYQNPLYVDLSKVGGYKFNSHPRAVVQRDGKKYPFSGNLIDTFDDGMPVFIWETYQSAEGSIIENIHIRCADYPAPINGNVELEYHIDYVSAKVINSYETGYSADTRAHGITSYTLIYIRNVKIERFYCHGVYLYGHASVRPSGSTTGDSSENSGRKLVSAIVDFSVVENSAIFSCGGNAIHLFGGDAAYCKISNLTESSNGGWTIADFSTLGNIILACNSNASTKTTLNADGSIKSITGGAYLRPKTVELTLSNNDDYIKRIIGLWWRNVIDDGGNIIDFIRYNAYSLKIKKELVVQKFSNTVFLNSYADGGFSFIAATNLIIGGSIQNFGTAGKIYGEQTLLFTNGLTAYSFQHLSDPLKDASQKDFAITKLGGNNNTFSNLSLEFDFTKDKKIQETSNMYRLLFQEKYKGWWEFASIDPAGGHQLQYQTPLRLSTKDSDIGQNGQIWFENGFYLGKTSDNVAEDQRVKVITGNEAPSLGTWKIGDRVLNVNPDPNDMNPDPLKNKSYAGWIFTSLGWKPYGKIEV